MGQKRFHPLAVVIGKTLLVDLFPALTVTYPGSDIIDGVEQRKQYQRDSQRLTNPENIRDNREWEKAH